MPIQFPDFQRISFAEANPFLTGVSTAQDMFSTALKQHLTSLQGQKAEAELPYAGMLAKSTADYKSAMAKYLSNPFQMQRFMTPLGKSLNEQQMLGGSGQPVTSGGSGDGTIGNQDVYDAYGRKILKDTSDSDARKRNLFSTNIEKTVQSVNPADLTEYSGVSGLGKHAMDTISSVVSGQTPDRMARQAIAAQNAEALATQVRQFYGASITPTQMEELNKLTNPSSWRYDQSTAMKIYDKYIKLLGTEMNTYRSAMQSPDVYTGRSSGQQGGEGQMMGQPQQGGGAPEGRVEAVKTVRGRQFAKINGQWYEQ